MTLSPANIIEIKKGIVTSQIDGETVMMSLENSEYYGLNSTASRIFALVEKPISIQIICNQLISEYNIDFDTCYLQVINILEDFNKKGLIEIK
ncbi:MAG: hypothetical protein A2046_14470 [Bacteroidetes bacterium GWA2_30_7]|nr:MAG: hypothetical protein A2046_14470 [Bacteroidetes bacterium GWA2_30_7]